MKLQKSVMFLRGFSSEKQVAIWYIIRTLEQSTSSFRMPTFVFLMHTISGYVHMKQIGVYFALVK